MPHAVATEARVVVRLVVDRLEPERRRTARGSPLAAGGAAAAAPDRKPGEPVEARAAEEVEEHRLGLVVGGVAGEHAGREHGVAGRTGAGLEVRRLARRRRAPPRKAAPTRAAAARTTSASAADPGRRPWSTCTAVTSQPRRHRQHQERERVRPARHRAGHRGAGRRERAAGRAASSSSVTLIGRRTSASSPDRASRTQQLGHVGHAELATDAAQAGVDVRPAHAELGGRRADGRRRAAAPEELALLVGEVARPPATGDGDRAVDRQPAPRARSSRLRRTDGGRRARCRPPRSMRARRASERCCAALRCSARDRRRAPPPRVSDEASGSTGLVR